MHISAGQLPTSACMSPARPPSLQRELHACTGYNTIDAFLHATSHLWCGMQRGVQGELPSPLRPKNAEAKGQAPEPPSEQLPASRTSDRTYGPGRYMVSQVWPCRRSQTHIGSLPFADQWWRPWMSYSPISYASQRCEIVLGRDDLGLQLMQLQYAQSSSHQRHASAAVAVIKHPSLAALHHTRAKSPGTSCCLQQN